MQSQLESIDRDFADVSYVNGWVPTAKDAALFDFCATIPDDRLGKWPHLYRWYTNLKSCDRAERETFPESPNPITALTMKVNRVMNVCRSEQDLIDRKVRQLFLCKQNCYKLYNLSFLSFRVTSCLVGGDVICPFN